MKMKMRTEREKERYQNAPAAMNLIIRRETTGRLRGYHLNKL